MAKVCLTAMSDGVFQLQMNDPESGNRLSDEVCSELMTALSQAALDPSLKVLVLTGGKDVFCGGASRAVLQRVCAGNMDIKNLALPLQLVEFPVPVVAALEGDAVGGGLVLAFCCDILVAAENRRFGLNFTSMGFTPGWGTTRLLPALVGYCFATEMILTGKFYKGRELQGRGLFNAVVPGAEVRNVALDIAYRIAERPRRVIEMVKSALALPRSLALQDAMSREHLMHQICFSHPDTAAIIEETYLD